MSVIDSVQEKLHLKEFKYLVYIAVIFVSVLLISNVASSKIVSLWAFDFDGGTLLFPLSYIFGDILTEVYGYKRVRKIIWIGFAMNVLMALVFMGVIALPEAVEGGPQCRPDFARRVMPNSLRARLELADVAVTETASVAFPSYA